MAEDWLANAYDGMSGKEREDLNKAPANGSSCNRPEMFKCSFAFSLAKD